MFANNFIWAGSQRHEENTGNSQMCRRCSISAAAFRRYASDGVCVCVCVCVRGHVYVVYEDTNLYNDMGMT